MSDKLLNSLHLKGFLSFAPQSDAVELTNLNVLIGPNGVGKSNFIEGVELLRAAPVDLSGAIRVGGTPADWIWRGDGVEAARIETLLAPVREVTELRYAIEFADSLGRLQIVDELLEEPARAGTRTRAARIYYRIQRGRPVINMCERVSGRGARRTYKPRTLKPESIDPQQSILSQKKDVDLYPELTTVGRRFQAIQVFREWSFGRSATLRTLPRADLPVDVLLPELVNLGLVLNDLEHRDEWPRFNRLMKKFLPRYQRVGTKIIAGSVQIVLHEQGLNAPVPATRLSDGTLRLLALLTILLNAPSATLICIEEPELGLHPDAMLPMADLLVEASERTQLIVTTHSEALVSALTDHAESVLVCDYLENGTTLRRLDSHKLRHWLKDYRLGDIWQSGKLGGNLW
jgi:predicted ATPase